MNVDWQLVVVALAACAAGVYAARRVLLQLQRPDDEPSACHSCPANPIGRTRLQRKGDAR